MTNVKKIKKIIMAVYNRGTLSAPQEQIQSHDNNPPHGFFWPTMVMSSYGNDWHLTIMSTLWLDCAASQLQSSGKVGDCNGTNWWKWAKITGGGPISTGEHKNMGAPVARWVAGIL